MNLRTFVLRCLLVLFGLLGACQAALAQNVLRVGMAAEDLGTLDPHRASSTRDRPVVGWIFNGLVRFPPGSTDPNALVGDLAERWEGSPDKLTWRFYLRKGVQFHSNFGEFTADDVVYSIRRAADPKRSSFSSDFASLASVQAIDKYTVEVKFKQPLPFPLGLFANYQTGYIVSRKAAEQLGDDFRTRPIGTGPFYFKEYQPQQAVVLAANENFFRGKPQLDGVVWRYIPSDATRDLAFESGELDVVYGRQDDQWARRMATRPNAVVDVFGPAELTTLHLNTKVKPLTDVRVRQAIALAVDPASVMALRGTVTARPATSVIPSGYLGSSPASILPARNLAKARALLAEAGYPNGLTIRTISVSLPTIASAMEAVQAQLKQAGITLELDVVDSPTASAEARKGTVPLVLYSPARFPVADVFLTQFFDSGSAIGTPTAVLNFSGCSAADSEIREARSEINPERQKRLWVEAQRKIVDAACAVPLYEALQVWARKKYVDYGYELRGSYSLGPVLTESSSIKK